MKDATQFHIRPARPDEAGLFYAQHPEEDKRLGAVGCVRMDFGRSGNEFWHTWWPRGPEELNSPVFKAELQEVVDTLRESVLKNRFATVTSWKPSITATACGAIRPTEITTATVRPMIWMSSGRTWRGKKRLTWRWEAWYEHGNGLCQRASRTVRPF